MASNPGPSSSNGSLPRSISPSYHDNSSTAPQRAGTIHLTPHSGGSSTRPATHEVYQGFAQNQGWSQDPRSSSLQSLLPQSSDNAAGKRTLLLVYIHGFLGNEMSFQSFPAHVHNLLMVTLAESHVVHTKIYPRYKSRRAIEFARDDFSKWITPHEGPETDVVLLGHSMGGILSAEVALLGPQAPFSAERHRHRILGIVNFDTPFLGMHPGVIVSGLSSLFRPGSDSPKPTSPAHGQGSHVPPAAGTRISSESVGTRPDYGSRTSGTYSPEFAQSSTALSTLSTADSNTTGSTPFPLASPTETDPNYNPPFPNDIHIPTRSGWNSAVHFVTKHSDGLTKATRQYVTSHLEFGGCLADYPGLRRRYAAVRALEDVDELQPVSADRSSARSQRVRFLNYYTASTGRPKKPILQSRRHDGASHTSPRDSAELSIVSSGQTIPSASRSPRISVEEHRDDTIIPRPLAEPDEAPVAAAEGNNKPEHAIFNMDAPDTPVAKVSYPGNENSPLAPTIPPPPPEPRCFDPSRFTDREALRRAEKEHGRLLKTYQRSVKERNRAIRDGEKMSARRGKQSRQDWTREVKTAAKKLEAEAKQRLRAEKQAMNQPPVLNPEALEPNGAADSESVPAARTKKDKKFCMLPPKVNGRVDPTWIRVYMEGVDEVGAHCSLFFLGEAYEKLVGDVATRVEDWVREDGTRRLVKEMEGMEV